MHPKQPLLPVNAVISVGFYGPVGTSGRFHIKKKLFTSKAPESQAVFARHLLSASCTPGALGTQA